MPAKKTKSKGRNTITIQMRDLEKVKLFEWLVENQVPVVTPTRLAEAILAMVAQKCQEGNDPYLWRKLSE